MTKSTAISIVLSLINILLAFLFWNYWSNLLYLPTDLRTYIPASILTVLFISVHSLLIIIGTNIFVFLSIVATGILTLFVGQGFTAFSTISAAIFILGSLFSFHSTKGRSNLFKKISLRDLIPGKDIFTPIALSLALLVTGYSHSKNQDFRITIPDSVFSIVENITQQIVGTNTNQAANTKALAEQTFNNEVPKIRQELISRGLKDEDAINAQIEKSRQEYLEQVDIQISQNSSSEFKDNQLLVLKKALEDSINNMISGYKKYFPFIIGASFFFSIMFFASIFVFFAEMITFALFEILILAKLVSIKTRTEEVEYIET